MKIAIGITLEHLAEVANSLNKLLADEHVLYIQTRNAHWNVEGPDFLTKHKLFEEQYQQIEAIIDDVAEHRALCRRNDGKIFKTYAPYRSIKRKK